MRVLNLAENLTVGGGGISNYVHEVSDLLIQRGHETAVCYRYSEALPGDSIELFHLAPTQPIDAQIRQWRDIIRTYNPSVIYCHILNVPELVHTSMQLAPTVGFVHGLVSVCPGMAKYFRRNDQICERPFGWGCAVMIYMRRCSQARNPLTVLRLLEQSERNREAYSSLSHVFVASTYMENLLIQNGFDGSRLQVLPPQFVHNKSEADGIQRDLRTILFAGRLEREKGLAYLLNAMSQLPRTVRLKVAGDGSLRNEYENLVLRLGIQERVQFLGRVAPASLESMYRGSLCLVVPSIWPEPFGKVGIEAMSLGCPVIATKAGGIPEWLHHGENGLLVEPASVSGLVQAITSLLDNAILVNKLGEAGRARAHKVYSPDAHVEKLLSAFQAQVRPDLGIPQSEYAGFE